MPTCDLPSLALVQWFNGTVKMFSNYLLLLMRIGMGQLSYCQWLWTTRQHVSRKLQEKKNRKIKKRKSEPGLLVYWQTITFIEHSWSFMMSVVSTHLCSWLVSSRGVELVLWLSTGHLLLWSLVDSSPVLHSHTVVATHSLLVTGHACCSWGRGTVSLLRYASKSIRWPHWCSLPRTEAGHGREVGSLVAL